MYICDEHGVHGKGNECPKCKERVQVSESRSNDLLCPFCGGVVDPKGWLDGNGNRGPECEVCGATAPDMETWNNRYTGKPDMSYR